MFATINRKLVTTVAAIALLTLVILPSMASAAKGQWYTIPSSNGNGSAMLQRFLPTYTGTETAGIVSIASSSTSHCVYVGIAGVTRVGLDGGFSRATSNWCGTSPATLNWYKKFNTNYDGVKFHLCKVINNLPDACGDSVTIYP
jgi:hypothetical protein